MILDLPAPTAAEQAMEDFDPAPWIAAALDGVQKTNYQQAVRRDGLWCVSLPIIETGDINGALVRYSDYCPATFLRFKFGACHWVEPGDFAEVRLHTKG